MATLPAAPPGPARGGSWRLLAVALALLLLPFALPLYLLNLTTEAVIFALFAASLDLLLGYTGLVSLGHAAFFGVGAYTAGLVGIKATPSLLLTLPAAVAASALVAAGVGYFCVRSSGIFFLMLTLAFSQMIYAAAHKWIWLTGGSNGLSGIPRPEIGPLRFDGGEAQYYLVLVITVAAYLLLRRLLDSPFGRSLVGIRENEARMRAIGYDGAAFKLAAFVVAGAGAGLSGALYSYYNGFVSPQEVYWTMSGQAVVMVIVGGAGTLVGPAFGAALVLLLQNLVSSYTERWPLIMGAVFVGFVLFARHGLAGACERLDAAWSARARRGGKGAEDAGRAAG